MTAIVPPWQRISRHDVASPLAERTVDGVSWTWRKQFCQPGVPLGSYRQGHPVEPVFQRLKRLTKIRIGIPECPVWPQHPNASDGPHQGNGAVLARLFIDRIAALSRDDVGDASDDVWREHQHAGSDPVNTIEPGFEFPPSAGLTFSELLAILAPRVRLEQLARIEPVQRPSLGQHWR